jgi:hypothetical protein
VEFLVKSGADVFKSRDTGSNLLHVLCNCRPLDTNIYFNRSCLPYVKSAEKTLSADDLVEYDLDSVDALRIMTLLIKCGLPVNNKNLEGYTILEMISKNFIRFGEEFSAIIELLVSHGARFEDSPSITAVKDQFLTVKSALQAGIDAWSSKGILSSEGINIKWVLLSCNI